VGARGNTGDLDCQPFYRFIERTYGLHVLAMFAALFAVGGLPALVWGGALRCAWVYHITWFVNSASHVWGYQSYNTGDQRRAREPACITCVRWTSQECCRHLTPHMWLVSAGLCLLCDSEYL
jgi:fatty-acid desaturase